MIHEKTGEVGFVTSTCAVQSHDGPGPAIRHKPWRTWQFLGPLPGGYGGKNVSRIFGTRAREKGKHALSFLTVSFIGSLNGGQMSELADEEFLQNVEIDFGWELHFGVK